MSIEVIAKVNRENAVFIAGESFNVTVCNKKKFYKKKNL